ncbi:unnamed protein product [Effrenium voratum]|uniref:WD40 repeat domain-containing protein n=1 Tax=Effrenium voratum TaxID=2562239 RepID=A0AA36MZF6_9DINO|nr:unnamed protein product [Effrenium voratum]
MDLAAETGRRRAVVLAELRARQGPWLAARGTRQPGGWIRKVPHCGWRVASRSPAQWQVVATLEGHSDAVCGLAWSPDQRILTASADGTVGVWEAAEAADGNWSAIANHAPDSWSLMAVLGAKTQAPVRDAAWSAAGEVLAGSADGSARVWRPSGNASRILREPPEPNETVNGTAPIPPPRIQGRLMEHWTLHSLLQSPDTVLAVEWRNGSVMGRVLAGAYERTACSQAPSSKWSPCSGGAARGLDHSAAIWHASKEMPQRWALESTLEGTTHLMVSVRWSPDGQRLLTGGSDGRARIWQLADVDFHGSGSQRWDVLTEEQVHTEAVRAVAWSPDGELVLTSGRNGYAYIWRPFNRSTWSLEGFLTQFNGQKVPPNLTNTAAHLPEEEARLDTLDPHSNMGWISDWSPIWVASWSPDGRRILTGSKDGSARIWLQNMSVRGSWSLEATLQGHSHEIWAAAWSPDSLALVTADQVGRARLWRAGDKAAGAMMAW